MKNYSFETPGRLHLRVENKCGDVYLIARPGTTTDVEVTSGGGNGDELEEGTRVEHRQAGGGPGHAGGERGHTVVVDVPAPGRLLRSMGAWNGWVALRVELPEGADVEVSVAAGDITAEGAFGQARLSSASGDISVGRVDGDFRANTASGDVSASAVGGKTEVTTASGSVTLEVAQGPSRIRTASGDVVIKGGGGHVSAQSASGDVRIGEVLNGCQVQTASGDQELERAVSGKARLETMSGDLTVRVPKGTAVSVELETVTGSLSSEIELSAERPGDQSGAANEEEGRSFLEVNARTVTGDVEIKRLH